MSTQIISKSVPLIQNCMVNIRTSSNWDGSHTAANIALFNKNDPTTARDGSEGWVCSVADTNQYVFFGCDSPKTFIAITLQGRGDQDQWVTTYKLRYTLDGVNWTEYRNGATIQGCWDRNSPSVHFFEEPFRARAVSIHPLTWEGSIALRMELYAEPFIHTPLVQNGRISVNENTVLDTTTSYKTLIVPVVFPHRFPSTPTVSLGFSFLSTIYGSNDLTQISVNSRNVTPNGFDCAFYVHNDTRITYCNVDYVATYQE